MPGLPFTGTQLHKLQSYERLHLRLQFSILNKAVAHCLGSSYLFYHVESAFYTGKYDFGVSSVRYSSPDYGSPALSIV